MGGVMIVGGTLVGYVGAHLYTMRAPSPSGLLVLFLMAGLGAVGFADDYIKIFRQRSAGLRASVKLGGQVVVAVAFGAARVAVPGRRGTVAGLACGLVRPGHALVLPAGLFVVWVLVMVVATSNGVNLTDGLDGLATGTCVMVLGAYVVIGVWQFGNACSIAAGAALLRRSRPARPRGGRRGGHGRVLRLPLVERVAGPDLHGRHRLAGARRPARRARDPVPHRAAAAHPRRPVRRHHHVGDPAGRLLQADRRRVFLMAPLQHHFELKGWGEVTIVIRFWIIAGLCVGLGLGLFYAEWVGGGAVG